ncbi:MAG: TatD family hydrolase [Tannerellaceae bacterium]|jgi:TatD DNase family protein|nr:TatD family hydrolase [Tannerellaceae bacterium]
MGIIDTHCHLYLKDFDTDREDVIRAARAAGIEGLLLPNIDLSSIEPMHALCEHYPGFAWPMMGLHPTSVNEDYPAVLRKMESLLHTRPYCAIGETGIDLYWDKTRLKEQKAAFEEQLRWSIDLDLPVVIHTREAFPEVFDSIYKVGKDKLKGVFHSFSGKESQLKEINQLKNFKLGIGGVVTYKNARLPETLTHTGIEQIVLETDAPFLPPVPYRGKRNEPLYIRETAAKIASIYQLPFEETVRITRTNTNELFKKICPLNRLSL